MNAHTLAQPGITLEVSELTDLQSTAQSLRWRKNQLQAALQPGSNITHHLGHGMQFRELRPYQKGDDIRHINWKATARTGTSQGQARATKPSNRAAIAARTAIPV